MIKKIIQLEGLCIFIIAIYLYNVNDYSWVFFITTWLLPDFAAIGFIFNKKIGSICYNITHSYILVFIIYFLSIYLNSYILLSLTIVFLSHIGFDRFVGYGLKYPDNFNHTHIQNL